MLRILSLCIFLIHICTGFRWSSPVVRPAPGRSRYIALHAAPSIGEHFNARLDDVTGSVRDSVALFSINDNGRTLRAKMPTKTLTLAERMSLKVGATLSVCVTKNDAENLEVLLSDHRPPKNENQPPPRPSKRKWLVGKLTKPEPTKDEYFVTNGLDETVVPNGGLLLSSLKTGTRLEGEVIQSTEYGAFIDCNIYRLAKGRVLQRTHGILHKSEIAPSVLKKYGKLYDDPHDRYKSRTGRLILDVGTRITVYVKHVFKNQGRISFTTDPTINKAKLVEEVRAKRESGSIRRTGRRLRRELATVEVGDLVHGVVQKVVPQGVLVTVTSLGTINATGLIGEKFLPKQYQMPSNINSEYRLELLNKEFSPGRPIICSVHRVFEQSNADMMFSMKLMMEELGPALTSEEDKVAGADESDAVFEQRYKQMLKEKQSKLPAGRKKHTIELISESEDEEEEEDYEDSEGEEGDTDNTATEGSAESGGYDLSEEEEEKSEADYRRIYQDLRQSKEVAEVGDIYEWEEVKEVVEEKLLTMQDFKDSLHCVGVPVYAEGLSAQVKLKQFIDFAGVIQYKIFNKEAILAKMDDPVYLAKRDKAKQHIREIAGRYLSRFRKFGLEKIEEEHADEVVQYMEDREDGPTDNPNWVDDALPQEGDDEYTLALKQQYRELRGTDKALHHQKFRQWQDIQDLLNKKAIKPLHLDVCMRGAQKRFDMYGFNFSEFEELVALVDQAAKSDDPDWERIERENNLLDDPNFVPAPPTSAEKTSPAELESDAADEASTSTGGYSGVLGQLESMAAEEEEELEKDTAPASLEGMSNLELYQQLTCGDPLLNLPHFRTWPPIQRLISEEQLTSEGLDNLIDAVLGAGASRNNRKKVDPVQFDRLVNILKRKFPDMLKEAPSSTSEGTEEEEGEFDEEDDFEDDIDGDDDGDAEETEEEEERQVNTIVDEVDRDDDSENDQEDDSYAEGEEEEEEADMADDESVLSDLYDLVRDQEPQLLVSQFKQWDEITKLKTHCKLTFQALDKLLNKFVAPTAAHAQGATITREQFSKLMQALDETYGAQVQGVHQTAAEAETADMQERQMGIFSELFDRLRGSEQTLTVGQFKKAKEVQSIVSSIESAKDSSSAQDDLLHQILSLTLGKAAAFDQTPINLEQFAELMGQCMEHSMKPVSKDEQEKFWRDHYEEIRQASGSGSQVYVSDVMEGAFVKMALTSQFVTAERMDLILAVALQVAPDQLKKNRSKTAMNYDQFRLMVMLVDNPLEVEKQLQLMRSRGIGVGPKLKTTLSTDESDADDESGEVDDDGDENENENEPSQEEMLSSLYEDMKDQFGGEASVKSFLKSEFIAHALREGHLSRNQVSEVVIEVMGAGAVSSKGTVKMSEEQYVRIMKKLDASGEEQIESDENE